MSGGPPGRAGGAGSLLPGSQDVRGAHVGSAGPVPGWQGGEHHVERGGWQSSGWQSGGRHFERGGFIGHENRYHNGREFHVFEHSPVRNWVSWHPGYWVRPMSWGRAPDWFYPYATVQFEWAYVEDLPFDYHVQCEAVARNGETFAAYGFDINHASFNAMKTCLTTNGFSGDFSEYAGENFCYVPETLCQYRNF